MEKIYTITMIRHEEDRDRKTRCWGWFQESADAARVAIKNDGDSWENYYNYAVVEEYEPGIWRTGRQIYWFKANYDSHGLVSVSDLGCPPDWAKRIVNFAMG